MIYMVQQPNYLNRIFANKILSYLNAKYVAIVTEHGNDRNWLLVKILK